MKLLCNGFISPIGVDKDEVRLSALTFGENSGECALSVLSDGNEILSHTFSNNEPLIFHCPPLKGGKKYYCTLFNNGKTSAHCTFETMPEFENPTWITAKDFDGRSFRFSQNFLCDNIKNARLYISGLGFFDAQINGKRLDENYYKPHLTNYSKRPKTQCDTLEPDHGERVTIYTYDVESVLSIGENVIDISVAPGFFCNDDKISVDSNFSFGEPKLFYTLVCDGKIIASSSDSTVKAYKSRESSTLYIGQKIDFTADAFTPAKLVKTDAPDGKLTSPKFFDDKVIKEIKPKVIKTDENTILYDFGINHTGGLKISVKGKKGDKLAVNFAEVLKPDGTPNFETGAWHGYNCYTDKGLDVYQAAEYILSGDVDEIKPTFSWNCYRYAEITATPNTEIFDIVSLYISTDIEYDGSFNCSDETLNEIGSMFNNTLKCNFHHGIISDCPHRERLPYTGDGRLIMKSVLYSADSISFYYKWLYDLLDTQQLSGFMPNTAPYINGGGGYAWANALCTVPMTLYEFTGDTYPLTLAYPHILKLIDFYNKHHNGDYCINGNSQVWLLGDWLAPDMVTSDPYYISTVCFYEAVTTAAKIATILNCGDSKSLNELADNIKNAVITHYFNKETLTYGNGVQGEDVLALYYGLYDNTDYEQIKAKVDNHYRHETDYHLDTGIVITPVLIRYLTENGMEDIAFKIMTSKTYPSYHYLMLGETTFPEHWSKVWPDYTFGGDDSKLVKGGGDLSHCHPMYGSIVEWLYESVAGLNLSALCDGYIKVAPKFISYLDFASAEKSTMYGKVSVKWKRDKDIFKIKITVPNGIQAKFYIPKNAAVTSHDAKDGIIILPPGTHELMGKIS